MQAKLNISNRLLGIGLFAIMATGLTGTTSRCENKDKDYNSPERFEKEIQAFEASDNKQAPPKGAIVCMGSSSLRGWHSTIKEDLAPLTVIPRGFGGSNMNDALYYADRIILAYKPRAVVIYEGDNDVAQNISPARIHDTFKALVKKINDGLPDARIYFISIKPSISRWSMWPNMKETNRLIANECENNKQLTFLDITPGMLGPEGEPLKEIFKSDKLHMTRDGYIIWRDIIRPVLLKNELQFESK